MLPLEHHGPSYMKELTGHLVEVFGADLLTQIQIPPDGEDPDSARERLAGMLAVAAEGEREPLEQLHARFIHRLHLASDDFPATAGLRVTELALGPLPRRDWVRAEGHRAAVPARRR